MSTACLVATYPYGPSLRLIYGALNVSFTSLAGNFRSEQGKERLLRHGFDCTIRDGTDSKAEPSMMGSPLIKQVPYGVKYEMKTRLQMLTDLQCDTAIAIFQKSHKDGALVTLYNQRLVLKEPSPRTRAKVGTVTGAPAVPGMEYYFAQHRVWIESWTEPYRMAPNFNYLDFDAVEWGAPIAPGVANDVP